MCVVSMIGDHYKDKWKDWPLPQIYPWPISIPKPDPDPEKNPFDIFPFNGITRKEFDQLKKEVEELKKLLTRAKEYDEKNNEPNCELEEKMKRLKQIAALVGIDLDEVFKPKE